MTQDFVTITIPLGDRTEWNGLHLADIESAIAQLGNPARGDLARRLRQTHIVHFLSMHVIAPEAVGRPAHLVIEATVDGSAAKATVAIAAVLGDALLPILRQTSGIERIGEVLPLLERHRHRLTDAPFRFPGELAGLPFNGLPGLTARAIRENRLIVHRVRKIIAARRALASYHGPQTLFEEVSCALEGVLDAPAMQDRARLSFAETRAAPWLEYQRSGTLLGWAGKAVWEARQLVTLIVLLPWLAAVGLLLANGAGPWTAIFGGMAPGLMFILACMALIIFLLRRDETRNTARDRTPAPAAMAAMAARENAPGFAQNHMISVTTLRRAPIRRFALSAGFSAIRMMARLGAMRAGFLATIGTIHAARWFVLPGTRQLVFTSNYGGSWESYLEDFITKSSEGATGVWSNTEGFPETSLLFWKGASDGDRFKRFARRSMKPTAFWFSAYPALTTETIRKHALIVSGLLCRNRVAASPSDAEAWLDLLGTNPRPEYGLQYGEIQTLMFGGLRRHPHSRVVALRFDAEDAPPPPAGEPTRHVQDWLADLISRDVIAFGDKPPEDLVCNIAFSAEGLARLGLARELRDGTGQGFPAAFALGMADPGRKRVLGDPQELAWCDRRAHVTLLFYARSTAAAAAIDTEIDRALAAGLVKVEAGDIQTGLSAFDLDRFRADWDSHGDCADSAAKALPGTAYIEVAPDADAELSQEPFGFVDGVSQPLVRGFPGRHGAPDPVHAVEPGEFILGYADNRGHFPPSPLIERTAGGAEELLPAPPPSQPAQYPDFSARATLARDFGRNGSYLVIRQLAQDVDGFHSALDTLAETVCRHKDVINPHSGNFARTREWIAAKMVGRWRDGSSLVDHPFRPAFQTGEDAIAANGFLYKDADPQGARCPFTAHVRRTFPRDSLAQTDPEELSVTNRHRLLRRGRPYLDKDRRHVRGTLFMCFNADIERQFEFVQQTWLGSPSFHGLEREPDPFVMHKGDDDAPGACLTIPGRNAPLVLNRLQRHVSLGGGGYFFLPGRRSLWFLCGPQFRDNPQTRVYAAPV